MSVSGGLVAKAVSIDPEPAQEQRALGAVAKIIRDPLQHTI